MRRKMRSFMMLAASVSLLAGCGPAPDDPEANAQAPANAAANMAAPAVAPPGPVKIESKDELLEFIYSWPAEAAAIAPLDQWLRGHAADRRARMEKLAKEGAAQARERDFPVRQYSFGEEWSVVADLPALLVLNAEAYDYTGGAHGMPYVATLIWDKAEQERVPLSALLDVPALARIARERFCANLDAERAKKRNTPERAAAGESVIPEFNRCVDMAEQEIVPVSKGGKALDTLRVEILPYEAGPYVEGTYIIDLPMDASLMTAVKPKWKGAFAPL